MAEGRMIKKEIAKSKKIAFLKSEKARSLYFMIYPHVDVMGRISADIDDIKAICVPLFAWNNEDIEGALIELSNIGLIILYTVDVQRYLEIVRFHDFQRINKDREAKSKIPPPNAEHSRVLQRTPENSSISKDKLSKDKLIEQPEADKLLKEVYDRGLNIYKLINKVKKQLEWEKTRRFPPEVLIAVCKQYLKDKESIKNEWAWFVKVIQQESKSYFANNEIAKGKEYKKDAPYFQEIIKKLKLTI